MPQATKSPRSSRAKPARAPSRPGALPSRDEILAFLSGAPAPNGVKAPARATKRDVARAFGVTGEAKTELKLLIKDLEADGAITRGRKILQRQGRLPAMVVADIFDRDRDGDLSLDALETFLRKTHRDVKEPKGMSNPKLLDFQIEAIAAYVLSLRTAR